MGLKILKLIEEINRLWFPVYPYLAREIAESYGRRDGAVLEIGPFAGVIFELQRSGIGNSFSIAAFPSGIGDLFRQEISAQGVEEKIRVIETDPSLGEIEDDSIDLCVFRGALFFPSLFEIDFSAIDRILRPRGVAFVGGGFGTYTPEAVIEKIGKRSRDLNLEIGKVEISQDQVWKALRAGPLKSKPELVIRGGLWVVMRRENVTWPP